ELYIGGSSIARGYLNKPELTAEKFINNPFQSEREAENNSNNLLYRTGDLVKWLPDGNLQYVGRNDFQVKIRGHRIELTEIENTISGYKGIFQSIALIKENANNKYLIVFYTSDSPFSEEDLLKHCCNFLPDYMIPNSFVHLNCFPLTSNGKIDRHALL